MPRHHLRITRNFFAVTLLLLNCFIQWRCTSDIKDFKLSKALNYAGKNAVEIQKTLDYFSKPEDSLQLRAAIFLIQNMPGNGYYKYDEFDNFGKCSYNLFKKDLGIDSINILKKEYEISNGKGTIFFKKAGFIEDIQTINSAQLIQNIEYAFKAWRMPWARHLDFNQFEEFILPYRIGNEPLQNWRKQFFENSQWIFDKIKNNNDPIEIAGIINDSMKHKYRYIHDAIKYFPGQFTVEEMNATLGGRCEDLNMIVGYWLRAIGIPTALEFTPYWANSNYGGHSWLSILDTTGKFVPMNPGYDNPVRDSLPFKGAHLAKAYRLFYRLNDTFYNKDSSGIKLPERAYQDITSEYLPVANAKVSIIKHDNKSIYLGVLNGTNWKPLITETIQNKVSVTFKNIAREVLYAPIVIQQDNQSQTVGNPFFLNSKGEVQEFTPNNEKLISIYVDVSNLRAALFEKNCQVVYWNNETNEWEPTGSPEILKYDPLKIRHTQPKIYFKFPNVKSDAVYRIIDANQVPDNFSYGRPFILNNELNKLLDY